MKNNKSSILRSISIAAILLTVPPIANAYPQVVANPPTANDYPQVVANCEGYARTSIVTCGHYNNATGEYFEASYELPAPLTGVAYRKATQQMMVTGLKRDVQYVAAVTSDFRDDELLNNRQRAEEFPPHAHLLEVRYNEPQHSVEITELTAISLFPLMELTQSSKVNAFKLDDIKIGIMGQETGTPVLLADGADISGGYVGRTTTYADPATGGKMEVLEKGRFGGGMTSDGSMAFLLHSQMGSPRPKNWKVVVTMQPDRKLLKKVLKNLGLDFGN